MGAEARDAILSILVARKHQAGNRCETMAQNGKYVQYLQLGKLPWLGPAQLYFPSLSDERFL